MKKINDKQGKPGPKPETVVIDGNWEDAIGKALDKKRPESGWPKEKPMK